MADPPDDLPAWHRYYAKMYAALFFMNLCVFIVAAPLLWTPAHGLIPPFAISLWSIVLLFTVSLGLDAYLSSLRRAGQPDEESPPAKAPPPPPCRMCDQARPLLRSQPCGHRTICAACALAGPRPEIGTCMECEAPVDAVAPVLE